MGHETLLTFFWADNFDHKVETQQGGKMVNTTHLMTFQKAIEDTNEDTCYMLTLLGMLGQH